MRSAENLAALNRRTDFLSSIPDFTLLGRDRLLTLSRSMVVRTLDKHEMVFRQGDISRDLYIVVAGKVRVFKLSPAGNETTLDIFARGEVFGEFAAIDEQPRSASAATLGKCTLFQIAGEDFLRHLRAMPELAIITARLLTGKVRWTAAYAEAVAQYDAASRLLHILLLYNQRFGERQAGGNRHVLDLGLNQSDLASLIGVGRVWLNHLLQDWRKRGLVEYTSGKIIILDLQRVQQERDQRMEIKAEKEEW